MPMCPAVPSEGIATGSRPWAEVAPALGRPRSPPAGRHPLPGGDRIAEELERIAYRLAHAAMRRQRELRLAHSRSARYGKSYNHRR
jgi:hypothetical protein